ncbi:TetR/AcrR family transcriptional regulator [Svornostia abyssi]|uniref:TetR/AcrR family transcriptional regulator n=1 Tax=Svornostia abyssi TaxID=2898438 RepID=A0ABY5PFV3_9ACTN|nr:TetR/AcrR family transcriptional regulator [Parviterribacteraceae bacterium J379]
MGAPDRRPAGENSDRILRAARTVFGSQGYEQATMDAIAAEAGVTKPTVYARYPSKAALYADLVHYDGERLLDHLLQASYEFGATSAEAAVSAGLRAYFGFFTDNPGTHEVLFSASRGGEAGQVVADVNEQAIRRVATIALAIADRHGRELTRPQARTLAATLLGAAQGAFAAQRREPEVSSAEAQAIARGVLVTGVQALAEHGP